MKTPFLRTEYNYDMRKASIESGLTCPEQPHGRAQQHFREECDINTIVKRFNLTGQLPSNLRAPQYMHLNGEFNFHDAMNAIVEANETFMAMPAKIRARFHNSAAEFVDFCSDPENLPEMTTMGLVERKPTPSTPEPSTPSASPGAPQQAAGASAPITP